MSPAVQAYFGRASAQFRIRPPSWIQQLWRIRGEEIFAEGASIQLQSEMAALQASQNVVRTSVAHSAIASCATFMFLLHFLTAFRRHTHLRRKPEVA